MSQEDLLSRYGRILATKAVEWGLVGPKEADRIESRHLANSLALTGLVPAGARVVDVGSGAGLPGLPLAIARPDLDVVLLEPLLRRSAFLTETVTELGLPNVTVVRARAEDYREPAEVVTARAVAPLDRLIGWTRHLFQGGQLLALKGGKAEAEIQAAAKVLARYSLAADVIALPDATVVRVR